jgi:hypothetical protein
MIGEVPYDQTVEDRVVAVLGTSALRDEPRDGTRMRGWLGDTRELVGATRDKGHFIAHCIGRMPARSSFLAVFRLEDWCK